jgi:hypothetical protein
MAHTFGHTRHSTARLHWRCCGGLRHCANPRQRFPAPASNRAGEPGHAGWRGGARPAVVRWPRPGALACVTRHRALRSSRASRRSWRGPRPPHARAPGRPQKDRGGVPVGSPSRSSAGFAVSILHRGDCKIRVSNFGSGFPRDFSRQAAAILARTKPVPTLRSGSVVGMTGVDACLTLARYMTP